MASTYSDLLRLEKQGAGENESTWGDIANTQFELLEDAIAGHLVASDADITLSTTNGATDEARRMIIDFSNNTLTADRTVTVPDLTKLYLVLAQDVTFGGFTITIRATTLAGTVVISEQENRLITVRPDPGAGGGEHDVVDLYALTAGTPALATNSNQLGGVAAASYARLDQGVEDQKFTKGQVVVPSDLGTTGSLSPDLTASNTFEIGPLTGNITLANPTMPTPSSDADHQFFTVVIRQSTGTLRTITWGPQYEFPGGTSPALTATANRVDVFTFMWNEALGRALMIGSAQDIPNA